jgi:hypothetical protein
MPTTMPAAAVTAALWPAAFEAPSLRILDVVDVGVAGAIDVELLQSGVGSLVLGCELDEGRL